MTLSAGDVTVYLDATCELDLAALYITTAAVKLSERERAAQPGAGALFCCRPGPRRSAPHRFKG